MRGEIQTVIDKTCDAAIELLVRVFCGKRFTTPPLRIAVIAPRCRSAAREYNATRVSTAH
jgi:hypothetical protein